VVWVPEAITWHSSMQYIFVNWDPNTCIKIKKYLDHKAKQSNIETNMEVTRFKTLKSIKIYFVSNAINRILPREGYYGSKKA
jgi:hypothetical protein